MLTKKQTIRLLESEIEGSKGLADYLNEIREYIPSDKKTRFDEVYNAILERRIAFANILMAVEK